MKNFISMYDCVFIKWYYNFLDYPLYFEKFKEVNTSSCVECSPVCQDFFCYMGNFLVSFFFLYSCIEINSQIYLRNIYIKREGHMFYSFIHHPSINAQPKPLDLERWNLECIFFQRFMDVPRRDFLKFEP